MTRSDLRAVVVIATAFVLVVVRSAYGVDAPAPSRLEYPLSVAVGNDGLLVADRLLPGIWRFVEGQGKTLFSGSKRFRTPLNAVRTVAVATDGRIYAGDSSTREVYLIGADGSAKPLSGGRFGIPIDIAVAKNGSLCVSDLETQRIWRLEPDGGEPKEVAELVAPRGLFYDDSDTLWAVAASGDAPLVRLSADGAIDPVVRSRVFEFPHDVVVDAAGTAYVSDNYAKAIWRVKRNADPERWITGPPLAGPVGLAIREGRILVADPRARAVFEVQDDDSLRVVAGSPNDAAPVVER